MSSEDNIIREEYRLVREWNTSTGETSMRLIPVDTQLTRSREREHLRVNVDTSVPPLGDLQSVFYDMLTSTLNATERLRTGLDPLELPELPEFPPSNYTDLFARYYSEGLDGTFPLLHNQEPVYVVLDNTQFEEIPRSIASRTTLRRNENCAICQSDYMLGEEILNCPCSHKFHTECGRRWFTVFSSKCPVCRQDLREQVE